MDRTSRFTVLAVLLMVLILLVSTGTFAFAQEGGGEEPVVIPGSSVSPSVQQAPVPGGPGFLMIPAAAFTPAFPGTIYTNYGVLVSGQSSTQITYMAPVNLPQGATVTKLVLYFNDTDLSQSVFAELLRNPVPGGETFLMASVASLVDLLGSWTYRADTTIDNPVIDNQANMYFIRVGLPVSSAELMISGVRIDYGYPVMLPAVIR